MRLLSGPAESPDFEQRNESVCKLFPASIFETLQPEIAHDKAH